MRLKFGRRTYDVLLKKHFIPIGIEEVIPELYGTPRECKLVVNGNRLKDRVALVTGAHKGIGFHIAMRLLKDGAKVIITGRNEDALKKTVQQLNTPNVDYLVWDIADGKEEEHFEEAVKKFGDIDILVNNAGVTSNTKKRQSFEDMDDAHYHYVHDINTVSTTKMCKVFVELFHSGTILNIISNTAVLPALDAYFTSKWALYSFTKAFAFERFPTGGIITVNGICPGPVKSDMTRAHTFYRKEIPNHRIGIPEEIAELAFLQIISGLNGQNGEITVCDGGQIYR